MHCDECGIAIRESPTLAVTRRSFSTKTQTLCPHCRAQSRRHVESVLWILEVAFIPLAILANRDDRFFAALLLAIPLSSIAVVIHELGHVAGARLVGINVFNISIGYGRRLSRFWLGSILIELNCIPIAGHVRGICAKPSGYRFRTFVYLSGGIVANALTAGLIIFYLARQGTLFRSGQWNWPTTFCVALAWISIITAVSSLVPYRMGLQSRTDGLRIIQLLRNPVPPVKLREQMILSTRLYLLCLGNRTDRAKLWLARELEQHPEDQMLQSLSGFILIKQGEFQCAVELFENLLLNSSADSMQRALLLNNLAWAEILLGDPARQDLAAEHSAEAVSLQPTIPSLRGTRGAVLIVCGETELGLTLLKQALAGATNDSSRASVFGFMALAYEKQDNQREARYCLTKARRLDPTNEVIPFVTSRLHVST